MIPVSNRESDGAQERGRVGQNFRDVLKRWAEAYILVYGVLWVISVAILPISTAYATYASGVDLTAAESIEITNHLPYWLEFVTVTAFVIAVTPIAIGIIVGGIGFAAFVVYKFGYILYQTLAMATEVLAGDAE